MMKIFIILSLFISTSTFAQKEQNKKVIYKYKQKETFDFGALSVKGKVWAPGDLSIKLKDRKQFKIKLKVRQNFDNEIHTELSEI